MTCVHCGADGLSMEYRLRCTPAERPPREVDLFLCTECLLALRQEPDIELVEDSLTAVVE